jgi:hypothetical protein
MKELISRRTFYLFFFKFYLIFLQIEFNFFFKLHLIFSTNFIYFYINLIFFYFKKNLDFLMIK